MAEYSYNGWLAFKTPSGCPGGLQVLQVGTEKFPPGVRSGAVWVLLSYVATQMNLRVEPVAFPGGHPDDDWGWSYRKNRNANNLSCHASGTAIDYNATRHPNGKRGTYSPAQVAEIRKILAEVTLNGKKMVKWGGDFQDTADEMHFEIAGSEREVQQMAALLSARQAKTTLKNEIKEIIMSAVDEQLPKGNHYTGQPESLGWAVREMESRIVDRLTAHIDARVDALPEQVVNALLARKLSTPTWRDGSVVQEDTTVAQLIPRAAEASISRHREEQAS